jgi:hypothetical protein
VETAAVFILALLILFAHYSPAVAGAWVQKKRGYFFKLTGSYLYTNREYDSEGNVNDIRANDKGVTNTSYKEVALSGYLEYGFTDRVTLVTNFPFKIVTSKRTELPTPENPLRTVEVVTGGLSDFTVSARLLLLGRAAPLSVQGGVKIPLGYDRFPPEEGAPLGSGKVDVEGWVLAGTSLYPLPAYVTGQVGYRLRDGQGISDEFLFQAEAGLTPSPWYLKATLEGTYSTTTPVEQESSTVTTTNTDVLKLIPTLGYDFSPWFTIGAEAFITLRGKNTVAGTTYVLGVAFTR